MSVLREQSSSHGVTASTGAAYGAVTGAAYAALFLLGVVVGAVGCFHFATSVVGVPVGTILAIGGNLAMCWLGGLGMRSKLGAALPAAGWLLVAMMLAVARPEGDVVVSNTALGLTFLFGGTVAAGIGIGAAPSAALRHRGFHAFDVT